MQLDMLEAVYALMRSEIATNRRGLSRFIARAERAEEAGSLHVSLLANAPLAADGAGSGDMLFISNGRKAAEGAGLGTGVPAYYDAATNTWLTFHDNTAVLT